MRDRSKRPSTTPTNSPNSSRTTIPEEPGDERPVEEYPIQRAAVVRARHERQIVEAVATARGKGLSWQRIGELLGTSAQAAQQRYGALVETA